MMMMMKKLFCKNNIKVGTKISKPVNYQVPSYREAK
jgi:hypothetical protein